MPMTRTESLKRLDVNAALKRADWPDLVHLSPEVAAVIMGTPVYYAEQRLAHARSRKSRAESLLETVAAFQRCPLPEVKSPTTLTYKLITNKRLADAPAHV